MTKIEELFENLESLDAVQLITLADSSDILLAQEPYDLMLLVQELASRLELALNLDVMRADEDDEDPIHEHNT